MQVSSTVGAVTTGAGLVTSGVRASLATIMSLAAQGASETTQKTTATKKLFTVSFNQDFTSLGIGTKEGYKLYSVSNVEKIEQLCENENEDTFIVERLFSSSLVAVVSLSAPRKLKVAHFKKNSEICNYSFPNTILAVKLNRMRLVVCLEESLYIHNIKDMRVLHTIRDTPQNHLGLCALSTSNDNCYLAYPGSNTSGQVQIFDCANLQAKTMIHAHDSPLAAIAFNSPCTKIATASEKGTVIRVFSVMDGTKLHELRRGMKRCASIYSLSFSSDSLFLVASSNTETVHVFKLEEVKEADRVVADESAGLISYFNKAVTMGANYLPSPVTDMLSQGRAFATVTLPYLGVRSVCAVATINKVPRVLVASEQGVLYFYNLNTVDGGECVLLKQHIVDSSPESSPTTDSGAATSYPGTAQKADPDGSYATIVKGASSAIMTEAEKMTEMANACESPPKDTLKIDDDSEFPPVAQWLPSDWGWVDANWWI